MRYKFIFLLINFYLELTFFFTLSKRSHFNEILWNISVRKNMYKKYSCLFEEGRVSFPFSRYIFLFHIFTRYTLCTWWYFVLMNQSSVTFWMLRYIYKRMCERDSCLLNSYSLWSDVLFFLFKWSGVLSDLSEAIAECSKSERILRDRTFVCAK